MEAAVVLEIAVRVDVAAAARPELEAAVVLEVAVQIAVQVAVHQHFQRSRALSLESIVEVAVQHW